MSSATIQRGFLGAGMALWGVLSGCAVLTVDVDVYKGALVNEEHVQLHQLVALATAAKPMLVQLRDSIEWPSEEMPVQTGEDKKTWYQPEYVDPPDLLVPPEKGWFCKRADVFCSRETKGYSFFRNNLAVRVNAVLGLYEELDKNGKKKTHADVSLGTEQGLTRLTEIYREASRKSDHKTSANHEDGRENERALAEHRLIDALVEFASKVLFLANHEGLASPPGTPGLLLGGAEKLNRGLFGDFVTDYSLYRFLNSELAEDKKQQYVRVLQAVGNSILFSANELRERDRYRDLSQKKVTAEVTAANSVYSPSPRKVLDDLLKELQREKDAAEKQLDEAKAEKATLIEQIGAVNPLTGLRAAEKGALDELNEARQVFTDYLSAHRPLAAVHNVLTDKVSEQIKAGWKAAGKVDAATLADFLTGADGIKEKLTTVRQAQNGIPTAKEIRMFDDAIKYLESAGTQTAFEAHRTTGGHTSMKRSDLLDEFTAHIGRLEAERAKRITQYEKTRDAKEEKHRGVQNEIAELTTEIGHMATLISKLPNAIARFETARTVIEGVKVDVLKEAGQHGQFVSPNAVYLLVASHLERKEAAESTLETQKPYREARAVLLSRTPPPGMPPLNPGDYQSPLEVMDAVIALLRHREMEVVERHGKGAPESKRATEALGNAYQHRASMLYIRPSSAYLRTSFPSTSLQDDPNLAWDNMLLKQGIRNLPFSSQLADILDPSGRQDRLLTSELDKQYWQNINRVRVSGMGFTNQVLAKDDVGNWYVKHYYGDTEDIAKSAKHLALFSLGTKLPIDLSHELRKASGSEKDPKNKEISPPLQRVFEKHKDAYQAQRDEVATKLEALHTKNGKNALRESIATAWDHVDEIKQDSDSRDALRGALDVEIQAWDKAAEALKNKSDQDWGQVIVKDIRALSRLEKMLSARIQEIDKEADAKPGKERRELEKTLKEKTAALKSMPSEGATKEEKDAKERLDQEIQRLSTLKAKAAAEVRRLVGPIVLDLLDDRKQALDRFEQAIMFIGDAANPKDPNQSQSN